MNHQRKKTSPGYRRLLQVLCSLVVLSILIARVDLGLLLDHFRQAPVWSMIGLVAAHNLVVIFLFGNGLYILLRRMKGGGYQRVIASGYKLHVLSVVVPGRIGDLGLYYFIQPDYSLGQSTAVVLVDKLISLLATVVLSLIGVGVLFSWSSAAVLAALALAGLAFVLWMVSPNADALRRWIQKRILRRRSEKFQGFRREIVETLKDARGMSINFLITSLRVMIAGFTTMTAFSWFGVDLSFWNIVFINSITQMVSLLPISFMGIGTGDAVAIALAAHLGAASEPILATRLLGSALYLIFLLLVFAIWMRGTIKRSKFVNRLLNPGA